MKWNENVLNTSINNIITNITDGNILAISDYLNFLSMIKLSHGELYNYYTNNMSEEIKPYFYGEKALKFHGNNYFGREKNCMIIKKNDKEINDIILKLCNSYLPLTPNFYKKKEDLDVSIKKAKTFLQECIFINFQDIEYIFDNYSQIIFKRDNIIALGVCHDFLSINDIYVQFLYEKNSNSISYVHELSHAYQIIKMKNDYIRKSNYNFSFLREIFPYFIELLFIEYEQKKDLGKLFFNIERNFYDNLKADSSVFISKNFIKNENEYDIKYYINKIYAIYFFNLYHINPSECIEKINYLNKNIGIIEDEQIIEYFNIDSPQLIDGYFDRINNLKRKIKLG